MGDVLLTICREAERKGKQMVIAPSIAGDISATRLLAINKKRHHQNHDLVRGYTLLHLDTRNPHFHVTFLGHIENRAGAIGTKV